MAITEKQASRLEIGSHSQISPLLEKCCLRLTSNESYQNAETEIEALTGMKVGHTDHALEKCGTARVNKM